MTRFPRILLSILALVATAAAAAPAAPPDLSPDPLRYVSPSRGFDTIHTALDLDVDLQSQSVAGSVTHTMRSLRSRLDKIELNCVELTVESVTIDGEPARYEYPVPGAQATSWIGGIDSKRADDRLVIYPDAPIERGREFTVTIAYHGNPKRGLYWIAPEKGLPDKRYEVWSQGEGEDNRYWIPCNDYPNDLATFEARLRVKKGYYALSNGTLVSQTDTGDGKTEFYWKLDTPQVSYLIMMAVAKYDVHEEEGPKGVKLMVLVPPGTPDATVERGFGRTADMVDFFNRATGIDYPYGKYAQVIVQNFIYGGMENTTATVENLRTLYDESAALTETQDYLIAHELAHQWWGDMVTCREWSHMWLNEGFATYYADLYMEYHEGDDAFRYQMLLRHRNVTSNDDKEPRPVVTDFYNRTGARNNFNIYQKGSSVLHMLRFLLGDKDYAAAIRLYGDRHKHDNVETYDLTRAVKDATGQNLDWFFEQWVYLAGHPKFRVSKHYDADAKTLRLDVRQTQDVGGIVPLFRVPLDVEITTDAGKKTHRIVCDAAEQEFYFDCDSRPLMVIFDKGDWNIKTLDFPRRTDELVYQLEHGDYIERVHAAGALGSKGSSGVVVEALRGVLLTGGHYGLRREAALSLGRLRGDDARAALFEGLEVDAGRVRLACAAALASFDHDAAVAKRLTRVFEKDPASEVRAKAVDGLVAIHADNAAAVCNDALSVESNQGIIRRAGLGGLATLKNTKALPALARYARPGNDRTYRHDAIKAYAKLARELGGREQEDAVEFLGGMIGDWFLKTREAVIGALQTVGNPAALSYLDSAGRDDPLERIRSRAERAARAIRSRKAANVTVDDLRERLDELEGKLDRLDHDLDAPRRARE